MIKSPSLPPMNNSMTSHTVPLSVTLYKVHTVVVDPSARLDHLNTEWNQTELVIDLTRHQRDQEEYYFDIGGFLHSNIVFIADHEDEDVQEDDDDDDAPVSVQELYLVLVVCVCISCLGVCAIVLVLSYSTKPHVHSDTVSLASNDTPLYSVVDKTKKKVKVTKATHEKQEQKSEEQELKQKSESLYEILSTLQFKSKHKSGNEKLENKKKYNSTLFYQNTGNGSNYTDDQIQGGDTREVQVEVHQESFTDSLENVSDVSNINADHALYENTKHGEKFYSFRKLQEKYRNIIGKSRVS